MNVHANNVFDVYVNSDNVVNVLDVNVVDANVRVVYGAPALGQNRQAYIYAARALHCQ